MRETVYWLLGPGANVRHAVEFGPSSLPAGQLLPTVCNRWTNIPFATPRENEIASRETTERCRECVATITPHEPTEVAWHV